MPAPATTTTTNASACVLLCCMCQICMNRCDYMCVRASCVCLWCTSTRMVARMTSNSLAACISKQEHQIWNPPQSGARLGACMQVCCNICDKFSIEFNQTMLVYRIRPESCDHATMRAGVSMYIPGDAVGGAGGCAQVVALTCEAVVLIFLILACPCVGNIRSIGMKVTIPANTTKISLHVRPYMVQSRVEAGKRWVVEVKGTSRLLLSHTSCSGLHAYGRANFIRFDAHELIH